MTSTVRSSSATRVQASTALSGYFAALRELQRCLPRCAELPRSVFELALDVLFADVNVRVGAELSTPVLDWARRLRRQLSTSTVAETTDARAPVLASVVNVVRGHSGTAFCEAHVLFLERLEQRSQSDPDPGSFDDELDMAKATYGDTLQVNTKAAAQTGQASLLAWETQVDGVHRELLVTVSFESGVVTKARADGGLTTSDALVLNAIFDAWQQLGGISPWEAFEIAGKTHCSMVGSTDPAREDLLLDHRSQLWFEWRPEAASVQLDYFSLPEVAKSADKCVRQYFNKHKTFELVGDPEVVISKSLAASFAAKLQEIRLSASGEGHRLKSPGLVFHASPSRDALRSILRRGFLLPGDWIQGSPNFLETEHGAGSGVGVYCSPVVDTADRYLGDEEDSHGDGVVIVALAAFGVCWEPREKEDKTITKSREQWFDPAPREGEQHGGWVRKGDFWVVDAATDSIGSKGQIISAQGTLGYYPDANGLYDGAYHSRRPQPASTIRDEVVLASTDQILPVLLVRYRHRQSTPQMQFVKHVSSNVYHYISDEPLPDQHVVCTALSDVDIHRPLPDDSHWALFVDWDQTLGVAYSLGAESGVDPRAPSVRICFVLDEDLCGSDFHGHVGTIVHGVNGVVQPAEAAAVWFQADGVDLDASVPFLPSVTFGARFETDAPKADLVSIGLSATRNGNGLTAALRFAVDGALRKLARETEKHLAGVTEPWHRIAVGDMLYTVDGMHQGRIVEHRAFATVTAIERDVFTVTGLEVQWSLPGGKRTVERAKRIQSQEQALTVAWEDDTTTTFRPAVVRSRQHARDVASETQFLFVLVSPFSEHLRDNDTLAELADVVGNCSSQLRGSGARCSWTPLVLGGDDTSTKFAAYLKLQLSTGTGASAAGGSAWWEPVHRSERVADVAQMLAQLQEDLAVWTDDGNRLGAEVSLDRRDVVHGQGFIVDPLEAPCWEARLRRPRPELEGTNLMRGTCLLFRGPPPRRVFIDGVRRKVLLGPEMCPVGRVSAPLELGFALEKLAQKLRVAALVGDGGLRGHALGGAADSIAGTRIHEWVELLRRLAAGVASAANAQNSLEKVKATRDVASWLWAMSPTQRAIYCQQGRSLGNSLARTTNLVDDALRLQCASSAEPDAAAWLRRISEMRFSRNILKRAAAAPDGGTLQQFSAELCEAPANAKCVDWLRSWTSALSASEHMEQARQVAQVGFHDMQSALHSVGMVGVQVRCIRTEASNVEPWMLIVDYVSASFSDTVSAACGLDLGLPLKDEEGVEAPDVVVLIPPDSEQPCLWFSTTSVYQAYLGVVFARNPICTLPGQRHALPVLVWVKCAEQLLLRQPAGATAGQESASASELEKIRKLLRVFTAALHTVRCAAQAGAWKRLAHNIARGDNLARMLTEADDGPQSTCLALAALCWSPAAASLWEEEPRAGLATPRLRRLSLALLAEAVSRGCRKLCRSRAAESDVGDETDIERRMLWDALGITNDSVIEIESAGVVDPPQNLAREVHSDAFDLTRALKRSALFFAPEGKYFKMGLTNCTPHGVVGSLLLRSAWRGTSNQKCFNEDDVVTSILTQLQSREISMKAFIETVLPGTNPSLVQAALYAQGLRYHNARERSSGVTPLSEPEQILRDLAREQRHKAYVQALQAKLRVEYAGRRLEARKAKRLAVLADFNASHLGFPRVFSRLEIEDMNLHRPADDQLELLDSGLLRHHCCYPKCPQYLADLRSEKDKQAEIGAIAAAKGREANKGSAGASTRRNGLFRHLSPMTWPEATGQMQYLPLVHCLGASLVQSVRTQEEFHSLLFKHLSKQLGNRPSKDALGDWLHQGFCSMYEELKRLRS